MPQIAIHVQLPLLRGPELFILHKLEVIGLNIAIDRENVKSVLKVHRESLLLEWESNIDLLVRLSNQLLQVCLQLLGLGLLDCLGHYYLPLDEGDFLDDFVVCL